MFTKIDLQQMLEDAVSDLSLSCMFGLQPRCVDSRYSIFLAIVCPKKNYVNIVLIGVPIKNAIQARFARHALTRGGGDGV